MFLPSSIQVTRRLLRHNLPLNAVYKRHYIYRRTVSTFSGYPKILVPKALGPSWVHTARRIFFPFQPSEPMSNFMTGWATSVTPHSTASDPAEAEALHCLELGTAKLEQGDVQGAKLLYQKSAEIDRNASSLFNLGVTHYHLSMSCDGMNLHCC